MPKIEDLPAPPPGKNGWPWTMSQKTANEDSMRSDWPSVSIVTPSYNQGHFIEETIRSVLLQGYKNLEYWIIDGGSTDQTLEVINKYKPWLTGWVSEKDGGQADAINKGWCQSKGEFLGWINSDDILLPGSIYSAVKALIKTPESGFIYGDLVNIDIHGNFLSKVTYCDFDLKDIVKNCHWISQQGNLIRRTVINQIGMLNPELHFLMDFDLWLRAGLVCKFVYVHQTLAEFRQHDQAKTSNSTYLAAQEIFLIYRSYFNNPDLPINIKKIQSQSYSSARWYACRCYYFSDKLGDAWHQILLGAKLNPGLFLQSRFWPLFAKLVFATLLGGRNNKIFHSLSLLTHRK